MASRMRRGNGFRALLILLLVCNSLLGCQMLPPGIARVSSLVQRYTMKDFAISAPGGEGWYVQMQGENAILFYRMADSASAHSIVAGVRPFLPPSLPKNRDEFEKLLKNALEKEQEKSGRFESAGIQLTPDNRFGDFSIFVHSVSKDFAPSKLPPDTDYLLLNIYAYYVKSPKTDTYLHVWYSERSRPGDSDTNIAESADSFFRMFQLLPVEVKP